MSEVVRWSSLSPRERDALVAEKVMDEEVALAVRCMWECGSDVGPGLADTERVSFEGDSLFEPVPEYTTDIAAAWEVVEEVASDGITMDMEKNEYGEYWVTFMDWSRGTYDKHGTYPLLLGELDASRPTAPEAICIAALRACGVEVET